MTGVEVDPKGRIARVAAGTIWADVVDAAVQHGLTALHGSAHDVGVVGYSLGGGIGWLARKHGLSSSSVLSAEVVTADGEVVRADRETNADLFWALRGGGGSFGDRHRGRDRPLPGRRGVRRLARLADGARGRGARRVGRVDEGRTGGGDVGRPDAPDPADPGDARAAPRPAARRRRGRVPRRRAGGTRAAPPAARPRAGARHVRDGPGAALTQLHQDPPGPVPGRGEGWMLDAFDARRGRGDRPRRGDGRDGAAPLRRGQAPRGRARRGPTRTAACSRTSRRPTPCTRSAWRPARRPSRRSTERIAAIRAAAAPWLSRQRVLQLRRAATSNAAPSTRPGDYERLDRDPGGGRPGRRLPREARDRLRTGRGRGSLRLPRPFLVVASSSSASRR